MKPKFFISVVTAFLLVASLSNSSKAQTMLASLNISATPNPFSSSTTISFNLYEFTQVRFSVLNMSGDEVFAVNKGNLSAGPYSFEWKGETTAGTKLPAGIYVLRIQTPSGIQTEKVVLRNE